MIRYILDTDHLNLLQRGHPALKAHFELTPPEEIAITIITVEEQMRGRLAQVKKAASDSARVQAYRWLRETMDFFQELTILDFDDPAHRFVATVQAS